MYVPLVLDFSSKKIIEAAEPVFPRISNNTFSSPYIEIMYSVVRVSRSAKLLTTT